MRRWVGTKASRRDVCKKKKERKKDVDAGLGRKLWAAAPASAVIYKVLLVPLESVWALSIFFVLFSYLNILPVLIQIFTRCEEHHAEELRSSIVRTATSR